MTQSPHSGKHDADIVEGTGLAARPLLEVRYDRERIPSGCAIMSGSFLTGKPRHVGGMLHIHPTQAANDIEIQIGRLAQFSESSNIDKI